MQGLGKVSTNNHEQTWRLPHLDPESLGAPQVRSANQHFRWRILEFFDHLLHILWKSNFTIYSFRWDQPDHANDLLWYGMESMPTISSKILRIWKIHKTLVEWDGPLSVHKSTQHFAPVGDCFVLDVFGVGCVADSRFAEKTKLKVTGAWPTTICSSTASEQRLKATRKKHPRVTGSLATCHPALPLHAGEHSPCPS